MSSASFQDGDIYYDNMEIMENIQKMKNARTSKDRPPLPSQPPPPGASYPPQLPPKKKNLGRPIQNILGKAPSKPSLLKKSLPAQTQNNKKSNIIATRKQVATSNPSSPPTPRNVNNRLPSQPKPQIKPLPLNLPAKVKIKQMQQPPLQSNTVKKTAIPQSPINPKPAQVWNHPSLLRTKSIVEEPLAPIVEEDTVSEISPRSSTADEYSLRQSHKNSEDEISQLELEESITNANPDLRPMPSQTRTNNQRDTRSITDNSDSDFRYAESRNESLTTQQPDALDDGVVRPYGMVDLQLVDSGSDVHNTKVAKFSQKQQREGLALKGFAKVPSALEKNGHLDSPSSPAPRSPADFGHSSEDSGSGVCAYMSIPIQMETGSEENAPSHLAANKETASEPRGAGNTNKYKDDEYIYDEIQDFNKDVASCDDAMQKALDDINEVLQSMNIDGISTPIPQPRAKRFPVAAGDKENGNSREYDNFSNNKRPEQTTSPKSSASQFGRRKFNTSRQDMALPAPPEPPPSPSCTPKSANVGKTTIRSDSQSSGDMRGNFNDRKFRHGRLSSEESESRDLRPNNSRSNLQELEAHAMKDNPNPSTALLKSPESTGKKELDSSSRRTSRGDIEESSEADSWSVSGKQSDTTSGIVKSTGNSMSSLENLRGSTKSLGRSSSFDRKKSSSFRAKFKFRVRSKSQDRYRGDSDSLGPSVSDAEEKAKSPRQRGSRLRRRLSRKRMENKEASETKSVEEFKVTSESRPSPSVSFIRRLLRKTKQSSNERPVSYGKPVIATPTVSIQDDLTADPQSPSQSQQENGAREKLMVSPPSRRARKMLHPRSAREKAMSDSSNSDMDNDHRRYVQAETLKQKDEYLEPCDPCDTSASGEPTRERGRRMNAYRSKQSRDRVDSSGMSSLHREKYKALVSLNAQTLKKITEKWLKEWRNKLPVGGFLITSWADIVIASKHPQCTIGRTVIYESYFATNPEHRLACQIFDRKDVSEGLIAHLENCSSLTAHPTLCSVCSHFYCKVPGSLLYPPREETHVEALCVVLSNVPAATLATYISQLRKVKEQKRKHKQILLMLLQLLQAMDNLSHSGFTPSNITVDNLIVTQDMGLLQVMPHMDALDHTSNGPVRPKTLMSQFSGVLSWTLQMGLDQEGMSTPSFPLYSYLSAILRISRAIVTSKQEFEVVALQRLVQCALWGPKSRNEVSVTSEDIYDTLSAWIEVKQAELVSDIAVLFTAKSETFPIYLFYKHEYFSHVDPRTLFQNLRVLGRI